MAVLIAKKPGKCGQCHGTIALGQPFTWQQPYNGNRLCGHCQPEAAPMAPTVLDNEFAHASPEQKAICATVKEGKHNVMVLAGAGTGKSSTIRMSAKQVPHLDAAYVCFNARNALEARQGPPGKPEKAMPRNVTSATFHAVGWGVLSRKLGLREADGHKCQKLLEAMMKMGAVTEGEFDAYGPSVIKLTSLAKKHLIDAGTPNTLDHWEYLVDHFGVDFDAPEGAVETADIQGRGIEIARELLKRSNADPTMADYDDMLYLTVKLGLALQRFPLVYVDEAQDTSPARRAILRMMVAPGGHVCIVGDPQQGIYAFDGADADAMDQLKAEWDCITLPLMTNYRCSKAVIAYAQQFCPSLVACSTAQEGSVQFPATMLLSDFRPSDVILSRVNANLITLAYRFIGAGIACTVLGRDIGKGLEALIKKFQGKGKKKLSLDEVLARKDIYQAREVSKWIAKGEDAKAQAVTDKCESLQAAADALPEDDRTVEALIARLKTLFSEPADKENASPRLTLSTVHKSKGLEYARVILLDPSRMPSKWARQAHEKAQEENIIYVARTRAKVDFIEIEAEQILEVTA